jgi:hypothetical protein
LVTTLGKYVRPYSKPFARPAAWLGLVPLQNSTDGQCRSLEIGLRRRRPSLVVAVALANKTARIAWALMHR